MEKMDGYSLISTIRDRLSDIRDAETSADIGSQRPGHGEMTIIVGGHKYWLNLEYIGPVDRKEAQIRDDISIGG